MRRIPGVLLLAILLPLSANDLLTPDGWLAGENRLQPRSGHPLGLSFTLPFSREDQQWTATLPLRKDLSRNTSFRLQTRVISPRPLQEVTLEFLSGNGGYRTAFTLHETGPTQILLPKALFTPYGSPAGWDQITQLRFHFWPRQTGRTQLHDLRLEARQDRVLLLDTESLTENADERYTARITLRHLRRILEQLGLPHGIVSPDSLRNVTGSRVLLIPSLPRITPALLNTLRKLSETDCALIVFEAQSPELARLLNVRLGPPHTSNSVGRFNQLRLRTTSWIKPPPRLVQHAWSFRDIEPLGEAFVLATWENAESQSTKEPAAILSPRGAWFNAAWRSGDLEAKADTLHALIGYLSPWSLLESARFHQQIQSPQAFRTRHPEFTPMPGPAANLWSQAERLFSTATSLQNQQKFPESLRAYRASIRMQQKAFAAAQPRWKPEVRGIWDQQGTGFRAGAWDETCEALQRGGFNTVFAFMATAGRAHYPSAIVPPSKTLETYGNQLTAFTSAAKAHGLQAHAWKICWKLNTRDDAFRQRLEAEGRLMQDAQGKTIPWLSLADPRNVQHELDSVLEILRNAPLDGIHLDYMRLPGKEADYGPVARKAFEQRIGRTLPQWPAEVLGPLQKPFQQFRQDMVHQAVQRISTAVRKEFPNVILSVAVWGAWPDCANAQAQDWPVWARNNWVDWVIPMNYTDNPHQFDGWLDLQRRQPGMAGKLLPGIGLISTNAELNPVQLLEQFESLRERDLKGYVLYRLDSSLPQTLFPYLRAGLHRH